MTHDLVNRRRSLRLKGYDYAQAGAYFITICTQDRSCLFGDVVAENMSLNDAGRMLVTLWNDIPERFPDVKIDTFVVMPNHLHGIVVLPDAVGAPLVGAPSEMGETGATTRVAPTLGKVVGVFKSASTVEYIRGVETRGWPEFRHRLWQRNYYEHVIRDETSLDRIRLYIAENAAGWGFDDENPHKVAT